MRRRSEQRELARKERNDRAEAIYMDTSLPVDVRQALAREALREPRGKHADTLDQWRTIHLGVLVFIGWFAILAYWLPGSGVVGWVLRVLWILVCIPTLGLLRPLLGDD